MQVPGSLLLLPATLLQAEEITSLHIGHLLHPITSLHIGHLLHPGLCG
jgi:hypothetical protein